MAYATSDSRLSLEMAVPTISCTELEGGGYILESRTPLAPYEPSLGHLLRRWARDRPDQVLFGERDRNGSWRTVSYAEANAHANALGQALLDRGLGAARPVAVLSGNSIDHALLTLAGFVAGVPIVPISPPYSLLSRDYKKLRAIVDLTEPGLVYVEEPKPFRPALEALQLKKAEVVVGNGEGRGETPFRDLLETHPTRHLEERFAAIAGDTVAKVLFSSGSTGEPKGIPTTHRMLCSNQQMVAQVWPFAAARPPVLVDWLPWSHTYGGSHNFNLVLKHGGTLYIDWGRPAPGQIGTTLANLADISPTIYFSVPAGFSSLLPHLERDDALAASFFRRLQLIVYAGAALSQDVWERLEQLARKTLGRTVPLTTSWGLTETAPAVTSAHYPTDQATVIGVPIPGVALKMAPAGSKFELRVKGPNVMNGYLKRSDLTAEVFDEEGYFRSGDAGRFLDRNDPARGLVFDGRLAENFKLSSGTWVHVGPLRIAALGACSPLLQDAVVTGHDREFIGLLAWTNEHAVRELVHASPDAELASVFRSPEVVEKLRAGLAAHNAAATGSSYRIERILLIADPPALDAGEITDKGYINQRRVLERRAELVERLYAHAPDAEVIVIGEDSAGA